MTKGTHVGKSRKTILGRRGAVIPAPILALLTCLFVLLVAISPSHAQETPSLAYGETVGNYFEEDAAQEWTFTGQSGEILQMTVRRIAGRFTPRISLLAPDGSRVSPSRDEYDAHSQTLYFYEGLVQDGMYSIRVEESANLNTSLVILNEYSLSLETLGRKRPIEEGLSPLPTLGIAPLADFFAGEGLLDPTLGITIFGDYSLSQPDPVAARNVFLLSGSRRISLNNANPLARGISAIAFLDDAVALRSTSGAIFYTDQDISALASENSLTTISLADGMQISSDFFRIESIHTEDSLVAVRFENGQRLISTGQNYQFLRRGGINGEGINAEAVNRMVIDGSEIQSDMQLWETMAVLDNDVRVYYQDLRILSESASLNLFVNDAGLIDARVAGVDILAEQIGMGDIIIRDGETRIVPLNGEEIIGAFPNTAVTILDGNVNIFMGSNGSFVVFPEGTMISTVGSAPINPAANFNNLGATPYDYHPSPDFSFASLPVNRANGNFFYQVTDFSVAPSPCFADASVASCSSLNLEWARTFNSLSPAEQSPSYQNALSMGNGWRHNYQYELDLRYAPQGQVELILPDASRHTFIRRDSIYRSTSLPSWTIENTESLGNWQAFTSAGKIYNFDQAGRLQRISDYLGHALLFSPIPRNYLGEYAGGVFVTDDYGRRLEVYADDTKLIREVRDVQGRSVQYAYTEVNLVSVQYPSADAIARYTYENGQLTHLDDVRSPYQSEMSLGYDDSRRVIELFENPSDSQAYRRSFTYNSDNTVETQFVNGQERRHVYTFDAAYHLIRHDTPRSEWTYRWNYASDTGRLTEAALPERAVLRYQYDEFGYLTRFTDPIFGANAGNYEYSYVSNGHLRQLSTISAPSLSNIISLQYDELNRLSSITRAISLNPRLSEVTQFAYDAMNRVIAVNRPDRQIAILYDEFGYPTQINEGSGLRVWALQYDIVGRLQNLRDGRGTTANFMWDIENERLSSLSYAGNNYTYRYDLEGNLLAYSHNELSESYLYDAFRRPISYTDTLGRSSNFTYDEVGNLLSRRDSTGRETLYTYDELDFLSSMTLNEQTNRYAVSLNTEANRRIYSENYPTGERNNYVYDVLGRLRQVTSFDRTGAQSFNYNLSYSALGYLTTIEESHVPAGRNLSISYDLLGRPLSSTLNNTATSRYLYNEAGQLASINDPENRVYGYVYDALGNVINYVQPDGTRLHYSYDENGNMTSYQEAGGAEYFYTYDALNRLIAILDPANNLTSYDYDSQGNLTGIVDANGSRLSFRYDDASRLVESTDARNNTARIAYDPRDRISRIEASGGLISDYSYDSFDNLIAITQVGGRETLFGRDNEGRVVSVTDPLGQTSFYAYNTIGTIGRFSNPLGNETTYRWSASGRILGYSDSSGASYTYSADTIGRLQSVNNTGLNQTIALNSFIEYDDSGFINAIRYGTTGTINSNQATIYRYTYTENGQIASYLPPEADSPYRFEYNADGRVIRSTDPENVVTSYAYDELGRVNEVHRYVDTEEEVTEFYAYDALGNLSRYTAPDGTVSVFTYDAAGNLTQRRDTGIGGMERSWLFEYDNFANLSLIIDPNGQESRLRYDLFGNLIIFERGGLSTRYEYDEVDNLRRIQYPAGQSVLMSYNALGQRVRYVDAENNGWSYSYDEGGNLSQINNPLGSANSFGYDVNNRLVSILYPNNAAISLTYDNRGNFSEIRLPNDERIAYAFDRAGNLSSIAHGTNRTSFERDNLGRVTTQTNPNGQTIGYDYDSAGNLTRITTPDSSQNRQYDSAGRLSSISDESGTRRMTYDAFGNLAQLRSSDATINYVYDAVGNLLVRDAGALGRMETEYDELYRPIRISMNDEWISLEYNENGWRTRLLRSNGIETRYVYDNDGRVRNILHLNADGERLDGFAYEYDAVGNVLRITRIDNWAVLYSYNEAQQLISERWLGDDKQIRYSASYTYDAAGNRVEQITRIEQGNPERTVFVYNSQNQLTQEIRNAEFTIEDRLALPMLFGLVLGLPAVLFLRRRPRFIPVMLIIVPFSVPFLQTQATPAITYSYDSNGNLSRMVYDTGGSLDFSYDAFNRLISVTGTTYAGEAAQSEFRYDALGNLVSISANEQESRFIYDAFALIATENAQGEIQYFAPTAHEIIMQSSSDGVLWNLDDALGTSRSFALPEGNLLSGQSFNSSAFGEPIQPYENGVQVPAPAPLFLGQIYEPISGLYLMGARAYDPRLGRFLQRDPVRHDPQASLYTYAANRPTSVLDPTGLQNEQSLLGLESAVPSIQAQDFIPSPALPPVPSLADVPSAQAAENARLLAVSEMAENRINGNIIPFMGSANCGTGMPATLWGNPRFEPNLPSPYQHPEALAMPESALGLFGDCELLPSLPDAQNGLNAYENREDFAALLHEVPLFTPLIEEIPALQALTVPNISVPALQAYDLTPSVIPAFGGQFGDLQRDTFAYYREILLPRLAPNPFTWQRLSQAENVAPFTAFRVEH